jgi:hypothetical protein
MGGCRESRSTGIYLGSVLFRAPGMAGVFRPRVHRRFREGVVYASSLQGRIVTGGTVLAQRTPVPAIQWVCLVAKKKKSFPARKRDSAPTEMAARAEQRGR